METWTIVAGIAIIALAFTFYRGTRTYNQLMTRKKQVNEKIPNNEIGKATYQGGYPPMPQLAEVTVGIAQNNRQFLMYDKHGTIGTIDFEKVHKIEKFTTRKNVDFRRKSVVLYGPLVPLIFRPKIAHFCVINYIDVDDKENNILYHSKNLEEIESIYGKLNESWNLYKRQR